MIRVLVIILSICCGAARADTMVAAHMVRAQSLLTLSDLALQSGETPGGYSDPAHVVGMEARVVLYPGRAIRIGDIGPPAVIERNQIVTLTYQHNGLVIHAEGRSLDRAGAGETIRVMNLSSRSTLSGTVQPDGTLLISR